MHGACADLIHRANIPTEMMVARSVRARECDHVMVAAMDAVHECNIVAGMVGQAHAKSPRIEFDSLTHIAGEHEDVRKTTWSRARHGAAKRRTALTRAG